MIAVDNNQAYFKNKAPKHTLSPKTNAKPFRYPAENTRKIRLPRLQLPIKLQAGADETEQKTPFKNFCGA